MFDLKRLPSNENKSIYLLIFLLIAYLLSPLERYDYKIILTVMHAKQSSLRTLTDRREHI